MNFIQSITICLIAGMFLLIFAIQYLKNKENMALIERNKELNDRTIFSHLLLTLGILAIGIATAILVGTIIVYSFNIQAQPLVYMITIPLFAGVSLIVSFYMAKKDKRKS